MPLTLPANVTVTASATLLGTVPPGSAVTLVASAITAVGTDATVTTSTGFLLPASVPVPLALTDYEGQAPVTLYGITATTSVVSVALST